MYKHLERFESLFCQGLSVWSFTWSPCVCVGFLQLPPTAQRHADWELEALWMVVCVAAFRHVLNSRHFLEVFQMGCMFECKCPNQLLLTNVQNFPFQPLSKMPGQKSAWCHRENTSKIHSEWVDAMFLSFLTLDECKTEKNNNNANISGWKRGFMNVEAPVLLCCKQKDHDLHFVHHVLHLDLHHLRLLSYMWRCNSRKCPIKSGG